jgi:hypothetical protein
LVGDRFWDELNRITKKTIEDIDGLSGDGAIDYTDNCSDKSTGVVSATLSVDSTSAGSLFSILSGTSMSSVSDPGPSDRLVQLLLEDSEFHPLCLAGLISVSHDRFERNFRRLLKSTSKQERQSAHFVGSRARNIAHIICNNLKPSILMKKALTPEIVKDEEPEDFFEESASDQSEDEVDDLQKLEEFIKNSSALELLRRSLRAFVYPRKAKQQAEGGIEEVSSFGDSRMVVSEDNKNVTDSKSVPKDTEEQPSLRPAKTLCENQQSPLTFSSHQEDPQPPAATKHFSIVARVEEHIGMLLAENNDLKSIYRIALRKLGKASFVNNMERFLEGFYLDLAIHAKTYLERAITDLLGNVWSRRRLAQIIADYFRSEEQEAKARKTPEIPLLVSDLEAWVASNAGSRAMLGREQCWVASTALGLHGRLKFLSTEKFGEAL